LRRRLPPDALLNSFAQRWMQFFADASKGVKVKKECTLHIGDTPEWHASMKLVRARCTYSLYSRLIHVYTFHEPSREAIDEWLSQMTNLAARLNEQPLTEPVLIIVDYSGIGRSAPINYTMNKVTQWMKNTHRRHQAFVAVIMGNNAIIKVVDFTLRTFRLSDTVRLFRSTDYDAAVAWLQEVQRQHQPSK